MNEARADNPRDPCDNPYVHPVPDTPRDTTPPRSTFRKRDRLTLAREYQGTYRAGVRKVRGPLIVFARPNGLDRSRLGLSVGRRVGNAVARNRVKRMVRESFRTLRSEMPRGYDLVVSVRAHEPLRLEAYKRLLSAAWVALDTEWRGRERRESRREEGGS